MLLGAAAVGLAVAGNLTVVLPAGTAVLRTVRGTSLLAVVLTAAVALAVLPVVSVSVTVPVEVPLSAAAV